MRRKSFAILLALLLCLTMLAAPVFADDGEYPEEGPETVFMDDAIEIGPEIEEPEEQENADEPEDPESEIDDESLDGELDAAESSTEPSTEQNNTEDAEEIPTEQQNDAEQESEDNQEHLTEADTQPLPRLSVRPSAQLMVTTGTTVGGGVVDISQSRWVTAKSTVGLTSATSFSRDTSSTLAQVQAKSGVKQIDDGATDCVAYMWKDGTAVYWWSNADTVYLPSYCKTLFYNCAALTSLDMSGFDTSKVTTMQQMFRGCTSLTSLDLSMFDTGSVTSMAEMFYDDSALTSLNVSSFRTGNVVDMGMMFHNCSSLTSLDVSGFDTGKVTSMKATFQVCSGLTSLNLRNFDTSSVTDMTAMFNCCRKLQALDLSSFNTSKVTNMQAFCNECNALRSINVSSFDTRKVENMQYMFDTCTALTVLDISNFSTVSATDMSYMFNADNGLASLTIPADFVTGSAATSDDTRPLATFPTQLTHTRSADGTTAAIVSGSTDVNSATAQTTYIAPVTVTFYNGSTVLGTQTFAKGLAQTLSTACQGSVSGYSFYGWATSSNTSSRTYTSGKSASFSADTSLYAIYSRPITFRSGTVRSATNTVTQYYYGGSAKAITTPTATKPNSTWTLFGWSTGTTATTSTTVSTSTTKSFTPSSTTYNAKFNRIVTVNYNANGGSGATAASTATQYYNSYGAISTPSVTLAANGFTAPTGKVFQQWGESASATTGNDAGSAYTGFSPTVGDTTLSTTLYAIWQSTTGTASITAQTYNSAKIALSTSSTANTSSYTGTASSGTCTISNVNAGTYYVWASAADDNSTLYLYTGKTVTVSGGGTGSATVTYYKVTPSASNATVKVDMYAGNSSSTTKIYTRSNSSYTYLLSGCYAYVTSGTVTGYSSVSLTKNNSAISSGTWHQITAATTFKAVGTPNTITVNFYQNTTKLGSQTYTYNAAQNLSTGCQGSVSGYSFAGWAASNSTDAVTYTGGQSVTNPNGVSGGSTSLYAVYSRPVTFYSGAAQGTTNYVTQYYYGGSAKAVTSPSITAPNSSWTAYGWWTGTSAGYSRTVAASTSFTPSATSYYATFSRTLTVNYNGNGASGSTTASTATQYYNSYGNISSPSVTLSSNGFLAPANSVFYQWGESSSAVGGYAAGAAYPFAPAVSSTTVEKTLYAVWQTVRVFSVTVPASLPVTLNADGSVSVSSDVAIVNGSTDAVKVAGVAITTANGWTLDDGVTQASLPVDSRKFALTVKTGTGAEVKNQTIAAGESLPLRYTAVVAAQSSAITDAKIADVVFTVAWA